MSRLFALHYIVLILLFYISKNVLLWTIVMDTIHHPHMSSFGLRLTDPGVTKNPGTVHGSIYNVMNRPTELTVEWFQTLPDVKRKKRGRYGSRRNPID